MPLSIGSNIASLRALRQLDRSTAELARSSERLSSGMRINRASDDAAGLAISEGLRVKNRVYLQGVRNVNDGLSALAIAEGAVGELKSVITRITELAQQAANGSISDPQRQSLHREGQELTSEYNRILATTSFNDRPLLLTPQGESSLSLSLQAGFGTDGIVTATLGSVVVRTTGTGSFGPATTEAALIPFNGMKFIDLNGDGRPDLVGRDFTSAGVRLASGTGFSAPTHSFVLPNSNSESIASADFNNDGRADLAFFTDNTNRIDVFFGNGDGTFSASSVSTSIAQYADRGLATDLNSDGRADLIFRDVGGAAATLVMLGNGDGTFGSAATYLATAGYQDNVFGDVNGDGRVDIVSVENVGQDLRVRLGNADGTFGASLGVSLSGNGGGRIELGDFNGDGKKDIAQLQSDRFSIFTGNGDGTFSAPASFANSGGGNSADGMLIADYNGDGKDDVAVYNSGNKVVVRLGNGDGTFGATSTFSSISGGSDQYGTVDVNNDGATDLVLGGFYGSVILETLWGAAATTTSSQGLSTLSNVPLQTRASALATLDRSKTYLDELNNFSSVLGAAMSRFERVIGVLSIQADNAQAARSRIIDADIAEEAAVQVRTRILQEAGAAVLAQANQSPAIALQLLRR